MRADGSDQRNLTNDPDYDIAPAWKPDGSTIVFASTRALGGDRWQLFTMTSDGKSVARLTSDSGVAYESPSWSPDGLRIACLSATSGKQGIWTVTSDGRTVSRLTDSGAIGSGQAWSPNGAKIVFESDADGESQIYVMNSDGTARTRLTNSNASDRWPAWKP